jgi:hypothetical protein
MRGRTRYPRGCRGHSRNILQSLYIVTWRNAFSHVSWILLIFHCLSCYEGMILSRVESTQFEFEHEENLLQSATAFINKEIARGVIFRG